MRFQSYFVCSSLKCFVLTVEGGAASATLREVDLPIVDDYVCEVAYSNINSQINSSIHICAGYVEGGKDSCQGKSLIGAYNRFFDTFNSKI